MRGGAPFSPPVLSRSRPVPPHRVLDHASLYRSRGLPWIGYRLGRCMRSASQFTGGKWLREIVSSAARLISPGIRLSAVAKGNGTRNAFLTRRHCRCLSRESDEIFPRINADTPSRAADSRSLIRTAALETMNVITDSRSRYWPILTFGEEITFPRGRE